VSASNVRLPLIEPHMERALATIGAAPDALDRALSASRSTGERPVIAAARLGLVDGGRLAEALAEACGIPRASAQQIGEAAPSPGLSPAWLRRCRMAPLAASESGPPLFGIVDPTDTDALTACAFACGSEVRFAVLSLEEWTRLQADPPDDGGAGSHETRDREALSDLSRGAPAVRAVDEALAAARKAGASDVHVRPEEDGLKVFIRVDGDLRLLRTYPLSLAAPVAARLKVLAGLDLAERRAPQDGRLSFAQCATPRRGSPSRRPCPA
jgi:general secretion pathway protein E